ncbi:MAG: hypothetical protein U5R46_09290 [Gammaproteobacteria bacterium]|nr:hypothetical protein [Gammaproteobacteria bacterium]
MNEENPEAGQLLPQLKELQQECGSLLQKLMQQQQQQGATS